MPACFLTHATTKFKAEIQVTERGVDVVVTCGFTLCVIQVTEYGVILVILSV